MKFFTRNNIDVAFTKAMLYSPDRDSRGSVGTSCEGEIFAALVGTYLPLGGVLLSLIEAHFDESIGSKGRKVLCVAGYLMTDRAARRLTREWCGVLNRYGLPYFRMSECAHGNGPFKALSRAERIIVETRMIEIIKRRTIKGMSVIMDLEEFGQAIPKHPLIGSPYTFCAHVIIGGVAHWIEDTKGTENVAYVFEAGHASQREANAIMEKIFANPELKSAQRYASHAFVDKTKSPPTQAADLLAWQSYTDLRRQTEGSPRRKDFVSLLRPHDQVVRITREQMLALNLKWTIRDNSLARLHFGDRR